MSDPIDTTAIREWATEPHLSGSRVPLTQEQALLLVGVYEAACTARDTFRSDASHDEWLRALDAVDAAVDAARGGR